MPPRTRTGQTRAFDRLSPDQFERLTFRLVRREGYERAELIAGSGDKGRDVVAWKDGRRFAFQCKRVQSFGAAEAKAEIAKLQALPESQRPHEVVFVVACSVGPKARDAARTRRDGQALRRHPRRVLPNR